MKTSQADTLVIRSSELLKASFLFEAIVHPMRGKLLEAILEEGRLTASELWQRLGIEEALCLQQLSILCGVGLLLRQPETERVFYAVNHAKMEVLYTAAEALLFPSFE